MPPPRPNLPQTSCQLATQPHRRPLQFRHHPPQKPNRSPQENTLGFTEAARRWLLGKVFVSAIQAPSERFVRLSFDGPSVDPETSGRCDVLCAVTGPNANLWLLDANSRLISALDPRRRSHFDAALSACSKDSAPSPAPPPDLDPQAEQNFLIRNKLIEAHEALETTRINFESAKHWLAGVVRHALKKQTRLTAALQRDLSRASDAAQDKIRGDLLAAHFHALRRGLSEIILENFFDDMRPITIPLDPARSPSDNLDRFYKRYRKYSAASDHILGRLIDAETRTENLTTAQAALSAASDWGALLVIARGWISQKTFNTSQLTPPPSARIPRDRNKESQHANPKTQKHIPYKTFVSRTGRLIWVGRSASDNDALTFRLARGNDLWFHAAGISGSHVVVRLGRDESPDQETLLDAATLAAHFSTSAQTNAHKDTAAIARKRASSSTSNTSSTSGPKAGVGGEMWASQHGGQAPLVEIHQTRCKFVRKPKGAPPGQVLLNGEVKALSLRLESSRLERLLSQSPSPDSP